MDVARRTPDEIAGRTYAFVILQRALKDIGLFQLGMFVQRHGRAGFHLEHDGRAAVIVLVKDLHRNLVDPGRHPFQLRCRDKM
ncbi:hypothetical protein D9M68_918580 [compost metagenome]